VTAVGFYASKGMAVLDALIDTIAANAQMLSELDGAIGDGDHGINMNKGFMLCRQRTEGQDLNLSEALDTLGQILFSEIGGSMGPLYGLFFMTMASQCDGVNLIEAGDLYNMLDSAITELEDLGGAKIGDKTLMDTLIPSRQALRQAIDDGMDFDGAVEAMQRAAAEGRDSTRDLVARVGRAARLGERSRGVLDAGAASCCLLLTAMGDAMRQNR